MSRIPPASSTRMSETLQYEVPWSAGYAWASPLTGHRHFTATWEDAVHAIQEEFAACQNAPVDSVVVYRQREAFQVTYDEPKPEPPAPVVIPPDTPQSLIQSVMDGTCADLSRASILASLWIAEALQGIQNGRFWYKEIE